MTYTWKILLVWSNASSFRYDDCWLGYRDLKFIEHPSWVSSSSECGIMWFQVNTNGILSFGSGVSSYTPTPFPISSNPVVAPFWGDVDIRYSGNVYYGWVWHHLMFRFNYHKHFNRPVPLHACLQVPVRITAIIVILIRNTIILTVAKLHSETLSSGLQIVT